MLALVTSAAFLAELRHQLPLNSGVDMLCQCRAASAAELPVVSFFAVKWLSTETLSVLNERGTNLRS